MRKKSKITRKATLGMMTLPELRFFCGTVAPRPENPRLLSLFPLEINFDAPPFRMLGDLIHSCHDSVRSLRFLYAMKPEIC